MHALDSRLKRLCRTLVASARMAPIPSGQSTSRAFAFFCASGSMVVTTSRTMAAASNVSGRNSSLPDSIRDRSSTSLISASRCLAAPWIFLRSGRKSSSLRSVASSRSSSVYRMMAFSGVRSSWLMFARN